MRVAWWRRPRGPVVIAGEGEVSIERFVVASLPAVEGTVIVDAAFAPPDAGVVARVEESLARVQSVLPGGRLAAGDDRIRLAGNASDGDARVGPDADPGQLVASAQAAFYAGGDGGWSRHWLRSGR